MTLPINTILTPVPDLENFEDVQKYLRDLNFELQDMYQQMTQNINGSFRGPTYVDSSQWVPTIEGGTIAGTITYTHQKGWAMRQGIMTEVWFDIEWTGIGGATGNLALDLPYKVVKPTGVLDLPFAGAAFFSRMTYKDVGQTAITVNPVPDTFNSLFVGYGAGAINASNMQIQANARIAGSVRYIGVEDE